MKIKYALLTMLSAFLVPINTSWAGNDLKYPAFTISDSLKKGADVVCRLYEVELTVQSKAKYKYREKTAYTLYNDKHSKYNYVAVYFDKSSKANFIKGSVYNAMGLEVKKLKKSDIIEQSAVDGGTLMADDRVKFSSLTYHEYPYTIEFEFEFESDKTLGYPAWQPQDIEEMAVEQASLKVVFPENTKVRYKELGMDSVLKGKSELAQTTTANGNVTYSWQINNLRCIKEERFDKDWHQLTPTVWLAPTKFEYEGFEGDMTSWNSFGQWQNKLNVERNDLPEATKTTIKNLTANATSDVEKIRIVYEYLQNKTRYVSVQLGIGGFQPFKASLVDGKSYGDCKALSFYTKCLLESIGIKANYTIIYGNRHYAPKLTQDFPISKFNHVILSVPLKNDTIWLECTSQTESFGYLSDFTSDRNALVVDENGGKLVKTPVYKAKDNTLVRTVTGVVSTAGDAQVNVATVYRALQSDKHAGILDQKPEQQKEWLNKQVPYPDFTIEKYNFSIKKERIPEVTENYNLSVRKLASKVGKRMFISPLAFDKWNEVLDEKTERKSDIYIPSGYEFTDNQSVEIAIPAGYKIESQPSDASLDNEFGSYSISYKFVDGKILCQRRLKMVSGVFPKDKYSLLAGFYKNIKKSDNQRFVFVSEQ